MCPSDVRICSASWACSKTTCMSWPVGGVPCGFPESVAKSGAFLSDRDGGRGGGESSREGRVLSVSIEGI